MFLNLFCLLLGLAGLLILLFGPGYNYVYAEKAAVKAHIPADPALDFVATVTYDPAALEPFYSTMTLEVFRLVVFVVCFLTVMALIGEWGEKRVLAFLVMVEVLLVFLAVLIVLFGASAGFNISAHYNAALCTLAAGGADTALALALFMTYYKASGETTLK